MSRILLPVRFSAWIAGELGKTLHDRLQDTLPEGTRVTRLPRGFLIEADKVETGPLVDYVALAAQSMEKSVQETYPIFHKEMGPVWTGTLNVIFAEAKA